MSFAEIETKKQRNICNIDKSAGICFYTIKDEKQALIT